MKEKLIGDKIREARRAAGLTQWQLANRIFVSESYIALIESNKRNPSINVLTKIAEELGLTTDHIVLDTSSRSDESFTVEWQNLIHGRKPEEIRSALKMVESYLQCLDELKG
ncbi:MAG: helix-turn-helix transcriptional regulator [Ruminiclostridium sp.]|nr:helix-turn-helix transcriptional regulator [Ruminiclostridium sp.]